MTWTFWTNFLSLSPWRLCMKFGYNWPSGFSGNVWNYGNIRILGQRSKNNLDPLYSPIFVVLIKMTVYIFRPKSSLLIMISFVLVFSHIKAPESTFELTIEEVNQGHDMNDLGSTCLPNAAYQVSRPLVNWFWRRRFLKPFNIYFGWWAYRSCDQDSLNNFSFPQSLEATYKIWLWSAY